MKEIKTEILISATPEKIWAILTKFDHYPYWNPFITSITGDLKVGSRIIAKIQAPEKKTMTFKPIIQTLEINKEISWFGHFILPGLFDGEHKFELIDNNNMTTTFKQSEKFKGMLIPLFKKLLEINTKKGFEEMNQKLKILAEHS